MNAENRSPKLSVLMTVYNGMPYLPEAVESILSQDFADFECIIVDDGSTDETSRYLKQLQDPRVLILSQENGGTAAASNFGLAHCRGEYLARMDADDITLPTRFGKQVRFLDKNPEIGLLGTQLACMGECRIGKNLNLPCSNHSIRQSLLQGKHALCHPTLMMRTQLLREIGGYWKLRLIDDWDMMLRMTEVTQAHNLDEVLHHYRVHRGSLNGSRMKEMRFAYDYSIDAAIRRQESRAPISADEFRQSLSQRPFATRAFASMEIYARSQYRLAVADILGNAAWMGYMRLAIAAMCQPGMAWARLKRMARK
jgi:glycosyltransferase involved in cell wall biosynthesis